MNKKTLTEGKPWKLILLFALPLFAGSLLQQLYSTVDTIVLGNFDSEAALSAVGTTGGLTLLFLALAMGFSSGAGVIIAQHYGAKRTDKMRETATTAILLILGLGLLSAGIGLLTGRAILRTVLRVPESLMDMAVTYFYIYALGLIFQFGYNVIAAILRAVGDSRATLYFLMIAAVINIGLDILFIGVLHWGVAGAAVATNIAQLCACVAGFVYMTKKYPVFRWRRGELRFNGQIAREVLRIGTPMALQQAIVYCGFIFIQRAVNGYGEAMTASFTVEQRIEQYQKMPSTVLQITMATFSAQNRGAGEMGRIKLGMWQTLGMSAISTLALGLGAFVLAEPLIGLFGISGQSAAYCLEHMRFMSVTLLIFAAYFPLLGMFQGAGAAFASTLVATTALGCRVLFTYVLGTVPAIGYTSLWWGQVIGWLIAGIVAWIYYGMGGWQRKKVAGAQPVQEGN